MRNYVPNPYQFKHDRLSDNSSDISTLILGSSHTFYGISPKWMNDSTFNLANISQIFHYDWLLLSKYEFKNLKRVILPVSYFSFFDKEFEETDSWDLVINYKIYMDIDTHSDFSKYNFELSHPYIYTKKLRSLIIKKPLSCDSLGYGLAFARSNRSNNWKDSWERTVDNHTAKDWSAIPGHMKYARMIAEYCKSRNIDLILITTPTWNGYHSHLDSAQLKKTSELIRTLQAEYQLRYLDYLKDERFTDDDFYDSDHLNDEGAKKFSTILKEDLGI